MPTLSSAAGSNPNLAPDLLLRAPSDPLHGAAPNLVPPPPAYSAPTLGDERVINKRAVCMGCGRPKNGHPGGRKGIGRKGCQEEDCVCGKRRREHDSSNPAGPFCKWIRRNAPPAAVAPAVVTGVVRPAASRSSAAATAAPAAADPDFAPLAPNLDDTVHTYGRDADGSIMARGVGYTPPRGAVRQDFVPDIEILDGPPPPRYEPPVHLVQFGNWCVNGAACVSAAPVRASMPRAMAAAVPAPQPIPAVPAVELPLPQGMARVQVPVQVPRAAAVPTATAIPLVMPARVPHRHGQRLTGGG